jgi:hypothetical protein
MPPRQSSPVWQQAIDALQLHERSNCTLRAACFSCAANVKVRERCVSPWLCDLNLHLDQACSAVAFRTFAMRDSLRRVISTSPLRHSCAAWPAWTAEVLTYVAVFGQGLSSPAPDRLDRASCSRVAAVLLHKEALAAAAATEGITAAETRASTPK